MSLTWPLALLSLLVIPVLLGAHVWQLRRKKRGAVRFSNVALIKAAMPKRPSWRRHVPVALLLTALGSLGVAMARPQASMKVPIARTSIILAMDVSRSMCATDVEPNRFSVSQDAARLFVEQQPKGTRIGLVAFAGFAELVVPPTTDKQQLVEAIDGFTTARGTAIGAATLKSIDALASVNPDVSPIGADVMAGADLGFDPTTGADLPAVSTPPVDADREYVPDIVVLLTDGANTRGIEPLDAAEQAAQRGVRVYTIGFGTTNPTDMVCTPQQLGAGAFDDSAFGGMGGVGGGIGALPPGARRQFLVIDEPTLRQVAAMTGGEFYRAEDADQLRTVFDELPRDVALQERDVEISVGFAVAGALLALTAIVLSLRWNRTP
jgi:Ca-activated chloride channel family protein